ncbi:hypothetical protein FG379_001008 [Cryptosporidium bovis]|uniref:uncharacterized protein n=1 Tax=Cryptosporidium bovis TaxID=310047 RepID=UPI00351A1486|nr:hypothetical protein FG379_001008 [Cryptosporidium bovis]
MENEAEENISTMIRTVKSFSSDKKVFLNINEEKPISLTDNNSTGIYDCSIAKSIDVKGESFEEDDNSCLTTTITANELCDSNSILSLSGVNIPDGMQIDDIKNEDIDRNSLKDKLEQSAFDIQPLKSNTGIDNLSSSKEITTAAVNTNNIDEGNEGSITEVKICTITNDISNTTVPSNTITTSSKAGRRSSAIHHEVGPRQLKYNQIGVYWKDKESRVYARFTWATRKYSKSFYVGPNKPYATVRDAEKAAIRFLLINSPLHRRSHLKHFRFTESDEEDDEPYVGSQALREARRTKGIMLHFPAPESDDEVWSHYNTSNVNPATLYGEIIKKMDNDNTVGFSSPVTSAREYVTSKGKQSSSSGQISADGNGVIVNNNKYSNALSSVAGSTNDSNISSDDLFLALVANQIDSDRLVERHPTGGSFTNPSTSTTVSTKKFKPCLKTETLDSSETNFFPSNQFTIVDQNVPQTNNPFLGVDYNTLIALQQAQMANYYFQQQVAYAAAANMAMTPNATNSVNNTGNTNPFIFSQYNVAPNISNLDSNRVDESDVDNKTISSSSSNNVISNNNVGSNTSVLGLSTGVNANTNGAKGTTHNSNPIQVIAESTMEQYGGIIPGQGTKAMPSSNISLYNTTIPGNYTDYMTAMATAAYSGWYAATPFGYTMPLVGSYTTPVLPSIIPNANIFASHFQNNILTGNNIQSNINTANLQKQVNGNNKASPLDSTVINSLLTEKETRNHNIEQEETSHSL